MRQALFGAMVMTGLVSLGCGPSIGNASTGASCNQNAACGGDIVGTWAIAETCNVVASPEGMGFCPQLQFSVRAFRETGTFTYGADGTATLDVTIVATFEEVLPPTCLQAPLTCEAIDASIQDQLAQPDSMYESGGCTSVASGNCECTFSADRMVTSSATYATAGSMLTHTANGTSGTSSYCVSGSTLIMSSPSTTGGPPAVYVLTKV
jgi:hypothetical protein